mgnify:FL=1
MKSIKRYETIINEALRAALEYDTPEGQINEFISFFGKHIGSDRIYIFEDDVESHVTNNTYEWCAEGVKPQINDLQGVNMEVIDWWYDSFNEGESVIISDVEELKGVHQVSYNMLCYQKVHNVVVSPLRHKGQIRGFFGVDNPPEGDYTALTLFLDMIGTMLISFLKIRNSFKKEQHNASMSSYAALSEIYLSMHFVDIKTGKYQLVKTAKYIEDKCEELDSDDFSKRIHASMKYFCTQQYISSVSEFVDIATLGERLMETNTIVHEFIGIVYGWCRERFIKVDSDEKGRPWHVLYCVEVIDEQKRREKKLLYLSETDSMTGINNRGSGERKIKEFLEKKKGGLLCLLDCDKFKTINDTYGHAVGDIVLIQLASALQRACRENDIVMRLGGDEFAMYLPGISNKEQSESFFKRLFIQIDKIFIPEMQGEKINVSLGASLCLDDDKATFDKLYHEADAAMYESKKIVGNHAIIYPDLLKKTDEK